MCMNTCFTKIFDNTNPKQQILNLFLTLLLNKVYISNNLRKNYHFSVFDFQIINKIPSVL